MSTLYGYTVWHLNLAFSSIEEEARGLVIERCYWPLLNLSEKLEIPMGIELTGFTLREIERLDPSWITAFRKGLDDGRLELIGSGLVQMIGPLVPARMTEENLVRGNKVYQEVLGHQPETALINEQAYSRGLVEHYLAAGYKSIVMDWNACATHHPEWDRDWRFGSQKAQGNNNKINLLWTHTIAFQKMQRLAHGDLTLPDYLDYIETLTGDTERTFPLYGNDVEIFDFRPGRFETEAVISVSSEWSRLEEMFSVLRDHEQVKLVLPRDTLSIGDHCAPDALSLETAELPIPVKKQHKYNVTRWAVSGRDDLTINSACWRIYMSLLNKGDRAEDADWEELCCLWASDFRTHITKSRWLDLTERMAALEKKCVNNTTSQSLSQSSGTPPEIAQEGHFLNINTGALHLRLNKRRGLAIDHLATAAAPQKPFCGTLPHGFFDDIGYGADWYSGNATFESPGAPKIADLNPVDPVVTIGPDGLVRLEARIATPAGEIVKTLTPHNDVPRIDYDILFDWQEWPRGSLRLGNFTLMPDAFDLEELSYRSHNGGVALEDFPLAGRNFDHGAPVSFLVSAASGLGLTEGTLDIGDSRNRIKLDVDMGTAALIGMVTHRPVGDSLFCRVSLSALEMDETRNPFETSSGPRRFRFSLSFV